MVWTDVIARGNTDVVYWPTFVTVMKTHGFIGINWTAVKVGETPDVMVKCGLLLT